MDRTRIEWTDTTWNPVFGCSPVSEGCRNCYAARMALRFSGPGQSMEGLAEARGPDRVPVFTGRLMLRGENWLHEPLHWRKPRKVFVNSMSDLFHEDVPFDFIDQLFAVMSLCPQHTFQVLTKRPERMAQYLSSERHGEVEEAADLIFCKLTGGGGTFMRSWPLPNVWIGTSVEDQAAADSRIPPLLNSQAALRFLSCEPLLGPVDLWGWLSPTKWGAEKPKSLIDWVIVGGESGPRARTCNVEWVRDLVLQCRKAGVPVFVKQLGAKPRSIADRISHRGAVREPGDPSGFYRCLNHSKGGDIAEWPEDLRVREFPRAGAHE